LLGLRPRRRNCAEQSPAPGAPTGSHTVVPFHPALELLSEHMFLTGRERLRSWLQSLDRAVDELLAGDEIERLVYRESSIDDGSWVGSEPPVAVHGSTRDLQRQSHRQRRAIARHPRARRPGTVPP